MPGWRRAIVYLVALCSSLFSGSAGAQDVPPPVTDADIERIQKQLTSPTDAQIERAISALPSPTEDELSRVPTPSSPNVGNVPQPVRPADADLRSITRGYEATVKEMAGAAAAIAARPSLLIFVSFSMPEKTLSRLVEQAARAQATLVLRGLTQSSIKETVVRVGRLIGAQTVSFQIDPKSFERFSVKQTPTFVLIRPGAQPVACGDAQCIATDAFLSVSGDVSLDYAVEFMQRQAPGFKDETVYFLRRLRG